jgi:galactofuranose transport system permease protein
VSEGGGRRAEGGAEGRGGAVSTLHPLPSTLRARTQKAAAVLQQQGALVALIAICIFGATRYYAFPTPENLLNVLRQNSMLGLVALGMTFVILTGGIDLSVGAVLAVAGVVAANLADRGTLIAVTAGVAAGALLGLTNGVVITKARIQPFIVTLAMLIGARGAALAATGEESVSVNRLASGFTWLGRGEIGPISVPVLIFALAYVAGWVVLRYTRFGRYVYAIGDNAEAARLMGLKVDRTLIGTYTLSGALAGLAGVILAARLGAGQPVAGTGWELDAIAAVVVGGTLLTGGQGGAGSTLIGVLLLGVIFNLFNLEGTISPWWQWALRGLFLLAVVVVQARLQQRAVRE